MRLNKNLITFFVILLTVGICSADLSKTQQLTNNNIIALAGSGDTLWLTTERGFNYQTPLHQDSIWHGFEDNELGARLAGLEFGGSVAAALLYNNNGDPGFWQFNHRTGKQQEKYFNFPSGVFGNENDYYPDTTFMLYAHGSFWVAFGRGGLLRYSPNTNAVTAIRPDDAAEVPPDSITPLTHPLNGNDSAKVVKEIGVIPSGSDSGRIWVAALSKKIWTYKPATEAAAGAWGALDTKPVDTVYAKIDSTHKADGFRRYLESAGNTYPEVNCIIFLPDKANPDSGTLAIGTNIGLYICRSAKPRTDTYGEFYLEKYVRPIKTGENYALPGILRGSADGRYDRCVFVYKLKKDGKVTIKVYDYNMSLVKTVIKGASRKSGTDGARSTDPASDFWDGTNGGGKRVWPGVYYYKITSSSGDRLFGKIILAQ